MYDDYMGYFLSSFISYLHVSVCCPPGIAADDSGLCTNRIVDVVVAKTEPTGWTSVKRQHSCPCKSADVS
jgi:hypothetical protein